MFGQASSRWLSSTALVLMVAFFVVHLNSDLYLAAHLIDMPVEHLKTERIEYDNSTGSRVDVTGRKGPQVTMEPSSFPGGGQRGASTDKPSKMVYIIVAVIVVVVVLVIALVVYWLIYWKRRENKMIGQQLQSSGQSGETKAKSLKLDQIKKKVTPKSSETTSPLVKVTPTTGEPFDSEDCPSSPTSEINPTSSTIAHPRKQQARMAHDYTDSTVSSALPSSIATSITVPSSVDLRLSSKKADTSAVGHTVTDTVSPAAPAIPSTQSPKPAKSGKSLKGGKSTKSKKSTKSSKGGKSAKK